MVVSCHVLSIQGSPALAFGVMCPDGMVPCCWPASTAIAAHTADLFLILNSLTVSLNNLEIEELLMFLLVLNQLYLPICLSWV